MRRARENFCQEHSNYEKQRKFILNWFYNNQPSSGEFAYTISGISVCWSAWTKVLGITRRRFFELKRDFLLGRRNAQHGASLTSREAPQREAVLNFLDRYFTENCDYMPNSSVWHLSSSSHKADVFQEFTEHMESTNQPVCSETFFRKLWNENYSHVKIPKVRLCLAVLPFQNFGHSPTAFPVQNTFVSFDTIDIIPFSYYNAFKSSVVFSFSSLSFFYLFTLSFLIFKSIHLPV